MSTKSFEYLCPVCLCNIFHITTTVVDSEELDILEVQHKIHCPNCNWEYRGANLNEGLEALAKIQYVQDQ